MKSHLELLREILKELGIRCCTRTTLDFSLIERRVKDEGLSFLTITLPEFCKDFEECLDKGSVGSTDFKSFKKSAGLPAFMRGFTSQIFDKSGTLLDVPNLNCIHAVRQVCLLNQKINLPCSDARIDAALEGYVSCEQEVKLFDASFDQLQKEEFRKASNILFGDIFSILDRKVYDMDLVPKHGPGTTQEGIRGNAKYSSICWTDRLERILLSGEFLFPSWSYFSSDGVSFLDPEQEPPVRVVTVPKTLKTPRIIAIEPVHMQYVQQALLEPLVDHLESSKLVGSMIGFSDQTPNQDLAREGSITMDLATLDLSEASDRVSNQLVMELTASFSWLSQLVQACRSTHADVPTKGIFALSKFASMGSALCFPMEAMVFLTVIFLGISKATGVPVSRELVSSYAGKVRVYGDDIVIPADLVHSVVAELEAFGFKLNARKSFWTGKFRESCGKEYYDGTDVSIVRHRRSFPTQRKHVQEIVSLVSLRNQLWKAGFGSTVDYLDDMIKGFIPFPRVLETSSCLGAHSYDYQVDRMCKFTSRPLVRGMEVNAILPSDHLEGYGALLKWFLKRSDEPFAARDHLERAGRPRAVTLKLGWVHAR